MKIYYKLLFLKKMTCVSYNNNNIMNKKIIIIMSINNISSAKANSNGSNFEDIVIPFLKSKIIEKNKDLIFYKNKNLKALLKNNGIIDKNIELNLAPGIRRPDTIFIDKEQKIIYIFEIKYQIVNGSVDEKLQTADYKLSHLHHKIKNYKFKYTYITNNWLYKKCDYLKEYYKKTNENINILNYNEENEENENLINEIFSKIIN